MDKQNSSKRQVYLTDEETEAQNKEASLQS